MTSKCEVFNLDFHGSEEIIQEENVKRRDVIYIPSYKHERKLSEYDFSEIALESVSKQEEIEFESRFQNKNLKSFSPSELNRDKSIQVVDLENDGCARISDDTVSKDTDRSLIIPPEHQSLFVSPEPPPHQDGQSVREVQMCYDMNILQESLPKLTVTVPEILHNEINGAFSCYSKEDLVECSPCAGVRQHEGNLVSEIDCDASSCSIDSTMTISSIESLPKIFYDSSVHYQNRLSNAMLVPPLKQSCNAAPRCDKPVTDNTNDGKNSFKTSKAMVKLIFSSPSKKSKTDLHLLSASNCMKKSTNTASSTLGTINEQSFRKRLCSVRGTPSPASELLLKRVCNQATPALNECPSTKLKETKSTNIGGNFKRTSRSNQKVTLSTMKEHRLDTPKSRSGISNGLNTVSSNAFSFSKFESSRKVKIPKNSNTISLRSEENRKTGKSSDSSSLNSRHSNGGSNNLDMYTNKNVRKCSKSSLSRKEPPESSTSKPSKRNPLLPTFPSNILSAKQDASSPVDYDEIRNDINLELVTMTNTFFNSQQATQMLSNSPFHTPPVRKVRIKWSSDLVSTRSPSVNPNASAP